MAEIVNLNRFRKARQKAEDSQHAAENRVRFGRTKAEKANDQREADRRDGEHAGKELTRNEPAKGESDEPA